MVSAGFDWDDSNREKCRKHGVSIQEIESVFVASVRTAPDVKHSAEEDRLIAVGRTDEGRPVFVVFTIRQREQGLLIRPLSARYMHRKEAARYEEST